VGDLCLDAALRRSTGKPFPRKTRDRRSAGASFARTAQRIGDSAMCKVLNKRLAGVPAGAVYIGRGGRWGNPFRIGPDGDRADVIAKHERWLAEQRDLLRALDELRGRNLVCFCAPLPCHGDLLLRLANASRDERIAWWRAVKATA
jgi:hypothetical protein